MVGRETAPRSAAGRDEFRSLVRAPELTAPCLRREEDKEFEGASAFTPFRPPGRSAKARRAAMAWGRALSTVGRIEGCSALRETLSMRLSSSVPMWRRPMSGDWR